MLKFLSGIIVLQAGTAGLCYALVEVGFFTDNSRFVSALIFLNMLFIVLMAFWFSAIARQCNFAEMESIREAHAKEREKLRVNAERQKTRLTNKNHKELLRETKRAYAMANIKVGAAVAGILALGGIMIYSQFVIFGLLMLTAAGGGLLGYLTRAKQEVLFRSWNPAARQVTTGSGEKQQSKRLP